METTPKSSNDDTKHLRRHTPTPKMSERKRNLFEKSLSLMTLIVDEDVDLGPMSPLQYSSSSCEGENIPFDRNIRQTTFQNILSSPKEDAIPREKEPNGEISTEKSGEVSLTDFPIIADGEPPQTTTIVDTDENSAASRVHLQEKTPRERIINCRDLRISFKKSLILGDLNLETRPNHDAEHSENNHKDVKNLNQKRSYFASVLSDNNSLSRSPKEKIMKIDADPRARTSLTFESISIPTNLFYRNENSEPLKPKSLKRFSLPILGQSSRPQKRRSSDNSFTRGCGHKIKRPPKVVKEMVQKKVQLATETSSELIQVDQEQSSRINNILKNMKNPVSRPIFFGTGPVVETTVEVHQPAENKVVDRFYVSPEKIVEEAPKNKFFKNRSTAQKMYKLSNDVVVPVSGCKITLPKSDQTKTDQAMDFSMAEDEEEEFEIENHEVSQIINKLTGEEQEDSYRKKLPYKTTDPEVISRQKSVLDLLINNKICTEENFKMFIVEPELHQEKILKILDDLIVVDQSSNFFPIFSKSSMRKMVSISNGMDKVFGKPKVRKIWKRVGDKHQLQIDAGQKKFGATYCAECDLLYSIHEPEDELMHMHYHNNLSVLTFRGWKTETVVKEVLKWGISGRIIAVQWNDTKPKLQRVISILEVVNRDMGCPPVNLLKQKTIVYLALAQNVVLGLCVAEPKSEANRIVRQNGTDFFSEASYPVKCGISRIWVATPYRNQGVASELIHSVRGNFSFGHCLTMDEVAFNSPTEAGKLLAATLANRLDFLVYP